MPASRFDVRLYLPLPAAFAVDATIFAALRPRFNPESRRPPVIRAHAGREVYRRSRARSPGRRFMPRGCASRSLPIAHRLTPTYSHAGG